MNKKKIHISALFACICLTNCTTMALAPKQEAPDTSMSIKPTGTVNGWNESISYVGGKFFSCNAVNSNLSENVILFSGISGGYYAIGLNSRYGITLGTPEKSFERQGTIKYNDTIKIRAFYFSQDGSITLYLREDEMEDILKAESFSIRIGHKRASVKAASIKNIFFYVTTCVAEQENPLNQDAGS